MISITRLTEVIRESGAKGWLFYNFEHRDRIADSILGIPAQAPNTRPWAYLVGVDTEPIKIVHAIEADLLDHLPGEKRIYIGQADFRHKLGLGPLKTQLVLANFSTHFPKISSLDYGTAVMLKELGFELKSSELALAEIWGRLSPEELTSHEEASHALHQIIYATWQKIRETFSAKRAVYEGDILNWLQGLFKEYSLITDWPLIVASGINTTLPHYFPQGQGALLKENELVQLDIWGKKSQTDAIYADISWVGFLARKAPQPITDVFKTVIAARDQAIYFIKTRLEANEIVTGAEVDQEVTAYLIQAGMERFIKHRSGHAIDHQVHGWGVNLDSKEFPDWRPLKEGACFSLEPGLYLKDFGMRTEINIYIKNKQPVISGGEPQRDLLLL